MTVLGPADPAGLGAVDAHEHLFLRSPALPGDDFGDVEAMTAEVESVRAAGVDTIVDLTPVGLGRSATGLAAVSRRTGVHVVAATGYHRDAHYPSGHWVYREPASVLEEVLLADLTSGIDERDWQGPLPAPSSHRAGIVKLGASYQRASPAERTRLAAGAAAARRTGAPVAVHCEIGTMGPELLDLLAEDGVPAGRVLLAHLDRNPDPGLHGELAARGAYLLYDTVGRIKYRPDSDLLDLIARMVADGHGDRLLLGTDVGRRSQLRAYGGGPGMAVLGETFVPRLRSRLGLDAADAILRANPQRALTWAAPAS
ncbi:phosphotriesterase-related protein [Jiangella alkaliphila]|uniref:Phosphotriesterase-related protein n=2 Tax=Jiangella alkaliphila TaxID=419479 RepID=A0A1H2L9V0_9ACTN|nr:phosphotriesterase-related protein [Jiangella alkaliphila]